MSNAIQPQTITTLDLADELDKTLDFQSRAWSAAKLLRNPQAEFEHMKAMADELDKTVDLQSRAWSAAKRLRTQHAALERKDALLKQALAQLEINCTNFSKGPSKSICKMLAGGNDDVIAAIKKELP